MIIKKIFLLCCISSLTACNVSERLTRVGKAPDMNDVKVYEEDESLDIPAPLNSAYNFELDPEVPKQGASLWKAGARTFFRDQRARSVGDILKVVVTINDSAKLNNQTQTARNETGKSAAPNFLGLEKSIMDYVPPAFDPTKLINLSGADNNSGVGKIDRKESINTTIASTVIKILPSNNLVIRGSQEVRVNNEVREVTVEGIVRPEDISADNSVALDQIAEARVSYGGRGNLSDYQQPRYGKQVIDALSPF